MKSTGDSHVPVVHIRVIRDKKENKFPCDFCFQTFLSTDQLHQHMLSDHPSLDIQDVFVCPVCKCCLLCETDLLDHLYIKHKVLTSHSQQPAICEFCGLYITERDAILNHHRTLHKIENSEKLYKSENVELTFKDISSMGMGNPECKTLFQVIEYPIERTLVDSERVGGEGEGENYMKVKDGENNSANECSLPNSEYQGFLEDANVINIEAYDDNVMSHSLANGDQSLVNHVQNFEFCDESSDRDESKEIAQADSSHIEMIICCNSNEKSVASGEIILTVESDKELVWSNDFMSQVINSSGILKRNPELLGHSAEGENSRISYSLQVDNTNETEETNNRESFEENQEERNDKQCNEILESSRPLEIISSDSYAIRGAKGDRQKKCSVCGIVFRQLIELEQHESSHHGIRVKCELCDDTFAFSKSLRSHYLRKHSSTGNFYCEECNKSFKCRSNLWSHRLTHKGLEARRFTCPECPQRFHTKTKLNVHLQTHTGEKKFQCGECHKGFVYQGLLLRHMRKHFPETQDFLSDDQSIYMVEVGEKTEENIITQ